MKSASTRAGTTSRWNTSRARTFQKSFAKNHWPRAAEYVKVIAEAVHYAHEQGTLHRDLKPSNVLIDERDQPHVTDFGLAKRLDGDSELTVSGQVLGTPGFMPPEQVAGPREAIG